MKFTRWLAVVLLLFIIALPISLRARAGNPLRVIATTTIIADVARNVGGDLVDVTALIPADSDTHAFQPTPLDAAHLEEADLVLVNGLGLETFLSGLEDIANVTPIVVSKGIDVQAFGGDSLGILGTDVICELHDDCDPHVWMNPRNVAIWAQNIAEAFAAVDPANAEIYQANADAYVSQLDALDTEVHDILVPIPPEQRILLTNHEFIGYFAAAYDFSIVGVVIPGGGTTSEPSPRELAALVDTVKAAHVPALFAEVSSNNRLAQTIADEAGVAVITNLYSESLSASDESAATYLDFMRYNARTITAALTGINP